MESSAKGNVPENPEKPELGNKRSRNVLHPARINRYSGRRNDPAFRCLGHESMNIVSSFFFVRLPFASRESFCIGGFRSCQLSDVRGTERAPRLLAERTSHSLPANDASA